MKATDVADAAEACFDLARQEADRRGVRLMIIVQTPLGELTALKFADQDSAEPMLKKALEGHLMHKARAAALE